MRYFEAPDYEHFGDQTTSIFLAGGITECPDWQAEMVELLRDEEVVLLNPRRKDFPMDDINAGKQQILWEAYYLQRADNILFWFPKESLCPIALYELGAWTRQDKELYIGVEPGYQREFDIHIQTQIARPQLLIQSSLESLAEAVKRGIAR